MVKKLIWISMLFLLFLFFQAEEAEADKVAHFSLNNTQNNSVIGGINGSFGGSGLHYNTSAFCKFGTCLECDSDQDNGANNCFFDTGYAAISGSGTQGATIAFWVYYTSLYATFLNPWGVNGDSGQTDRISQPDPNTKYTLINTGTDLDFFENAITTGTWIHVMVTNTDTDGGTCTTYINNTLNETGTSCQTLGGITNPSAITWNLFAYHQSGIDGDNRELDGFMDEVWYFNETLNQSCRNELYENNTYCGDVKPSDTIAPGFSNYNLTSNGGCTFWNTDKIKQCPTTDTTPTIKLNTSENANCRISSSDQTQALMGSSRDCTTTGAIAHTCTVIAGDALSTGDNNVFIACNDTSDNTNQTNALAVGVINLSLSLDGSNITRKYEYLTTVNLTAKTQTRDVELCIDVLDGKRGVNISCSTASFVTREWAENWANVSNSTAVWQNAKNATDNDTETFSRVDSPGDTSTNRFFENYTFTHLPLSSSFIRIRTYLQGQGQGVGDRMNLSFWCWDYSTTNWSLMMQVFPSVGATAISNYDLGCPAWDIANCTLPSGCISQNPVQTKFEIQWIDKGSFNGGHVKYYESKIESSTQGDLNYSYNIDLLRQNKIFNNTLKKNASNLNYFNETNVRILSHFDETTGTNATDVSGNQLHGEIIGATYNLTNKRRGNSSLTFGSGNYVNYGTSGSVQFNADQTFSVWAYASTNTSGGMMSTDENNRGMHLRIDGGRVNCEVRGAGTNANNSERGFVTNRWDMWTCSWDQSTGKIRFYRNCVELGTGTKTGFSSSTCNMTVGRRQGGTCQASPRHFLGELDEPMFWAEIRTADELCADYERGRDDRNITINMENRTDLTNVSVNITGLIFNGSYPENITIKAEGQTQVILPGTMIGKLLKQARFSFNVVTYSILNLSFSSAESKIIFYNVTTSPVNNSINKTILKQGMINLTFQISGSEVDVGNDFDYTNYFNIINDTFNLTGGTRRAMFDNFDNLITNTTSNWIQTISSDWSDSNDGFTTGFSDNYYLMDNAKGEFACEDLTCSDSATLAEQILDVRNISLINTRWDVDCSANSNGASGEGKNRVIISDGTTATTIYEQSCTGTSSNSDVENLTILRDNTTSSNWLVYRNNVNTENTSSSSLNPGVRWGLQYQGICVYKHFPQEGFDPRSSCSASMKIRYIEISGLGLNKSNFTAKNFSSNYTLIKTGSLYLAATNISAATINPIAYVPTGTSITYFLSNDNGTTWQTAESGLREVFTTIGNNLTWRVNLTTTNINITPIVFSLNTRVIPGNAENITIDVGNDGKTDFTYTGVLNSTNSPQNISILPNATVEYIDDFCSTDFTCNIPIKITTGSGGIVEVSNFNWSQNPNKISMNKSHLETCLECKIESIFTNGILEFDDIRFDYLGSKNITVITHTPDYVFNESHEVRVKYSKFNMTLPNNTYYWEFMPDKQTQVNVTPEGQTSSIPIWNLTNDAYDDPFDVYVSANSTSDLNSCFNLTFSNTSSKTGIIGNSSFQKLISNLSLSSHRGIWNWLDLSSCTSTFFLPYWDFCAICVDCVKTSDFCNTNIITQ